MAEIPIGFERSPTFDERNSRQKEKGSGGLAVYISKKSSSSFKALKCDHLCSIQSTEQESERLPNL
jgi:hypothetical protein